MSEKSKNARFSAKSAERGPNQTINQSVKSVNDKMQMMPPAKRHNKPAGDTSKQFKSFISRQKGYTEDFGIIISWADLLAPS